MLRCAAACEVTQPLSRCAAQKGLMSGADVRFLAHHLTAATRTPGRHLPSGLRFLDADDSGMTSPARWITTRAPT